MTKPNLFNKHLKHTGENYFEHFLFTFTAGLWVLFIGFVLIAHSIFPFILTTTASRNIKKINEVMQRRIEMLAERKHQHHVREATETTSGESVH